jgi:DNA-binding CsgD family transcriptional regulator
MLERFSATVEKLYAAAGDYELWNDALGSLEALSRSAGIVVNLVDKADPQASFMINSPGIANFVDETEFATYNEEVLPFCPRVAAGIANPNLPYVCDHMILSEAEMDRNAAYDWYGRHGLRYFIGAPLFETERYRLMWSFQRASTQGHAEHADVELFELLKPHVARALSLADQLGTIRSTNRFASAVLEALPQAVFALDRNGMLLFANCCASAVLRAADGLFFKGDGLRTRLPAEQGQLDRSIAEAALTLGGAGDAWVRVSRSNGGLPYAVFVAPLKVVDEELTAAQASVLVIVHDTAARLSVDPHVLTRLYGLTEAEARLASALGGGHSLESAAALLGIKLATARSELKLVFRKTGVSRQQDLVRLLTSLCMVATPIA